jgi:hypothetical protein
VTLGTVQAGDGGFFRWHGRLQQGWLVRLHAGALTGAPISIR